MWASAGRIIIESLEDRGIYDDRLFNTCARWVRDAVLALGVIPEYYIKSERVFIKNGSVRKPDGLISLRRIFLCNSEGNLVEAYYGGKNPKQVFDPEGCCQFYYYKGSGPLLMEDDSCFFFASNDSDSYQYAIIEYNGLMYDSDELVRVPEKAELAVKAYIEMKLTHRERKLNRRAVPLQEVKMERETWLQEAGIAYGKMKMPSRAVMYEEAEKNWGIRLPAPLRRYK